VAESEGEASDKANPIRRDQFSKSSAEKTVFENLVIAQKPTVTTLTRTRTTDESRAADELNHNLFPCKGFSDPVFRVSECYSWIHS
jgi:hypothetical protein